MPFAGFISTLYLIFFDKMANDGASGPHSMLHVPFEIGHRGQVVVMLVELSVVFQIMLFVFFSEFCSVNKIQLDSACQYVFDKLFMTSLFFFSSGCAKRRCYAK